MLKRARKVQKIQLREGESKYIQGKDETLWHAHYIGAYYQLHC